MRQKIWRYGLLFWAVLLLLSGCGPRKKESPQIIHPVRPLVIDEDPEQGAEEEEAGEAKEEEGADGEGSQQAALAELQEQIEAYIGPEQQKGTVVAVRVENLLTGAAAEVGNRQMESASLIKLFVAGCVYENLDLVRAQEAYAQETEELLRDMISVSDNDAANTLVTRLGAGNAAAGMEAVNRFCSDHGYIETHMGRLMLDFSAMDDNYTSVADCGKLLYAIYSNGMQGAGNILEYMRQQERRGKIPAGVPAGVPVANKTGELTTVENDAAVVYADNGAYSVCVMMSGLYDTNAGRETIVGLSSLIYDYMQALR